VNVDPGTLERRDVTSLVNALVAPRPIAWVSTLAVDGTPNLAPFSFFNAFSTAPPTVVIGPGSRRGVNKDSLRNARATGELTINMVSRALAETANLTSAELAGEVDEWELAGIAAAPSLDVRPPRVAGSPASLECRVRQVVDLGAAELPTNSLVIAAIVRVHVDDDALDGWTPDPAALDLVGRMGGDLWCTTRDRWTLPRPVSADPDELRAAAAGR
jgi:flavin reductase (DIM6/NTAB) family NADH-FMN oxidoreductase RutF